jgi:hypothetical protein
MDASCRPEANNNPVFLINEDSPDVLEGSSVNKFSDYYFAGQSILPATYWCFLGANHCVRTDGGALCPGADGPRPGAEQSAIWAGLGFPA